MFKNAIPFTLPVGLPLDVAALEEASQTHQWQACPPTSASTIGFVPALHKGAQAMVHSSMGLVLLAVRIDERAVPPQAVAEEVERRVAALLEREGRKPGRRQLADLKDEVTMDLRPRAFVKSVTVPVLLAPAAGLMLVGTSSKSRCDEVTSFVRNAVGMEALPVKFMGTQVLPCVAMTAWLRNGCPAGLALGLSCELHEPRGGSVRVTKHDLKTETVQHEIEAGKQCHRLALQYVDGSDLETSFVLDDALGLRSIKWDGLLSARAAEAAEDDAAYYDATFAIEASTLVGIYGVLVPAMGGVQGTPAKAEG